MGLIEILWTVTGVLVPLLLGTAWAMVGLTPPEFWIARACIGLAALIFGATALTWLSASEWPNAARGVLAIVIGAIAFVGFSESLRWINLREKLVLAQAEAKADKRAEIRARLQQCYVTVGPIIQRSLPKDISPDDFNKYVAEADGWVSDCATWIDEHLGMPARERFLDRTEMMGASYNGAINERHNTVIQNLIRMRQNLMVLIESNAWDKS
jgi:hypothetical protein